MRTLILATIFLAAAGAASAQPAQTSPILGDWNGIGFQVGPDGPQSSWDIELSLTSENGAVISYPSLNCKSELTRVQGASRRIEFTEHITHGDCLDGGRVSITLESGRLFWFWTKPGIGADASAVLYRGKLVS